MVWGLARLVGRLQRVQSRGIVSQTFHCEEAWATRLAAPVFKKVKLSEYFVELDRKFTTEYRGSALDVDIFAQAATSPAECEQLEELLYKLRRTPHTVHTPASTGHATVRALLAAEQLPEGGEQLVHLVKMLDDRTNYGLFLDPYCTVLVLDALLEAGRLVEGARVASQLMLQEESTTGPAAALARLAAWRYCKSGRQLPWFYEDEVEVDPDPDEVVRVRVKGMVPNNYNDDHFDLREPEKIIGKTLWYLNPGQDDVSRSLCLLGLVLWGKQDQAMAIGAFSIVEEVRDIIEVLDTSAELKQLVRGLDLLPLRKDLDATLLYSCREDLALGEEKLITEQKKLYKEWSEKRDKELQREYDELVRRGRIEAIEQIKQDLSKDEEKLFFFDNFDELEQKKDEKEVAWRKTFPNRSWSLPGYFSKGKYKPKPGQDRKVARWEKRETKRGPPK